MNKKVILQTRLCVRGVRGKKPMSDIVHPSTKLKAKSTGCTQHLYNYWYRYAGGVRYDDWTGFKLFLNYIEKPGVLPSLCLSFVRSKLRVCRSLVYNRDRSSALLPGTVLLDSRDLAAALKMKHDLLLACVGLVFKCVLEVGLVTEKEFVECIFPIIHSNNKIASFLMTERGLLFVFLGIFFSTTNGRSWGWKRPPAFDELMKLYLEAFAHARVRHAAEPRESATSLNQPGTATL